MEKRPGSTPGPDKQILQRLHQRRKARKRDLKRKLREKKNQSESQGEPKDTFRKNGGASRTGDRGIMRWGEDGKGPDPILKI